jgi:hypothetical protein
MPVSLDDILYAYRMFLGREPSDREARVWLGFDDVEVLRRAFMTSDEYRTKYRSIVAETAGPVQLVGEELNPQPTGGGALRRPMSQMTQKLTVGAIGSCLSNHASMFLASDFKYRRLAAATVVNSENFVRYFLTPGQRLPPADFVRSLFRFKPEHEKYCLEHIDELYPESLGRLGFPEGHPSLLENLRNEVFDVILLDNLNEATRGLFRFQPRPGETEFTMHFFPSYYDNEAELQSRFDYQGVLTGRQSAENWLAITKFMLEIQPKARVFFLCAQSCTSMDNPRRFERAVTFYSEYSRLVADLPVTVIPPIDVDTSYMKLPDADHFATVVYKALAGQLHMKVLTGRV